MIKGNLSFGFKAVVAGQKSSVINAEPQLIIASTPGKFSITPAVSSAMGLQPGDYIQFFDNINVIMEAIRNKEADLVAVAEENGVDINTPEGVDEIVSAFREFGIAKGHLMLNEDGTPKMANARTSKEEKLAYVEANRDELVAKALEAGVEDPTDEQLVEMVGSKQEEAYAGSKLATTSQMTGYGLGLNFTDSNMWNVMKSDLDPETRTSTKRVFNVDIKNTKKQTVENGNATTEVELFVLSFKSDDAVIARGSKAE